MNDEIVHRYCIWGHPVILKNNKRLHLNRRTGKMFITSSESVKDYEKHAVLQLRVQHRGRSALTGPLNLCMTFFGAWSTTGRLPDMSNLYQAPEDLLQKAGVIEDDRQVVSHNGSQRVALCDGDCPKRKSKRRCGMTRRCPYERVLIEITRGTYPEVSPDMYQEMPNRM